MIDNPLKAQRDGATTMQINHDRQRLLMCWIIEFRFTTWQIAIDLLGMKQSNGYRWLGKMADMGLIEPVEAILGGRLMVLTAKGLKAAVSGSFVPDGTTRTTPAMITGSLSVLHDLNVQRCVITRMKQSRYHVASVSSAASLGQAKNGLRPDALIEYQVNADKPAMIEAIEFERTAKSRGRVYGLLGQYQRAMKKGLCNQVIFVFDDLRVAKLYVSIYQEDEWPVVKKTASGQVKKTGTTYTPDQAIKLAMRLSRLANLGELKERDPYWPEPGLVEDDDSWNESTEAEGRLASPPTVALQVDADPAVTEPSEGVDRSSPDQPTTTGWRSWFKG